MIPTLGCASHRTARYLALVTAVACDSSGPTKPAALPDPSKALIDRIVFSGFAPCGDCPVSLWSARVDGTDVQLLRDGLTWPWSPSVSPDGREVAFSDHPGLMLVDAAGNNLRIIPTPFPHHDLPQWSPVDDWILFGADDPTAGFRQVYRIRPDGSDLERLTDPALGPSNDATWSPDGKAIALVRGWPPSRVVILDLATRTERTVTDPSQPFNGSGPSWSPDGRFLTFMDWEEELGVVITRLDLATLALKTLGPAEGNRPAEWAPDGATLLFGSDDFWLMGPDGTDRRILLADSMIYFDAAWGPSSQSFGQVK